MDTCTIDFNQCVFPPEPYESIPDDFIRVSSYSMPNTTATNVSQQFTSFIILKVLSKKRTVPLINCKRGDLPRCGTCKAYLSPFVKVDEEHRCWRCPLCGHLNSTILFTSLYDMRMIFDRPELHSLVFDIQPPKDNLFINGKQRVFLFMIDESILSFKSTSYEKMLSQLDAVEKVIRPTDQIGLIIYSATVTIVNLRKLNSQSFVDFEPELLLHPKEIFIDASEGFEKLKTAVKSFGNSNEPTQTVLYSAILWSCHVMKKLGGRLLIFSTGRNDFYGKGVESPLNDFNVSNSSTIFNLLRNRSISLSLFKVGPLREIEEWSNKTGGIIAPFGQTPSLLSLFTLETAWDAALSFRTSVNVETVATYGNGSLLSNGVYLFPTSKSDQSYVFELNTKSPAKFNGNPSGPPNFHFQFAIRFTDDDGLRKIRVINGMLPFSDITHFPIDEAALSLFLLRKRIFESKEKVFNSRVELTKELVVYNADFVSQLPVLIYGGTITDSVFLNNASVERFALSVCLTKFTFPKEKQGGDEKRVLDVLWTNSLTIVFPLPNEAERQTIADASFQLGMAPMNFFTPKDKLEFDSMVNNEREAKRWYSEVTGIIPK